LKVDNSLSKIENAHNLSNDFGNCKEMLWLLFSNAITIIGTEAFKL